MILCLVTDRRRLGAAVGAGPADWIGVLERQAAAASEGGVDFIQLREPDLEAAQLVALTRSLCRICGGSSTRILVNDRLDVALAAGASGVHLKESSILPEEVRRIAPPGFLVGCSLHSVAAVALRKAADFLIAGTVLPTESKSSVEYLNEDGLKEIVQAAAGQPVLGIGGLGIGSGPLLTSSGAAGLAGVGTFIPGRGDELAEFVKKRVIALRFGLESAPAHT